MQEEQEFQDLFTDKEFHAQKAVPEEKAMTQEFIAGFRMNLELKYFPRKNGHKVTSIKLKKAFRSFARDFMLRHYKVKIVKTKDGKRINYFKNAAGNKCLTLEVIPMQSCGNVAVVMLHLALELQHDWVQDFFIHHYWDDNTNQGVPYKKIKDPKYHTKPQFLDYVKALYENKNKPTRSFYDRD